VSVMCRDKRSRIVTSPNRVMVVFGVAGCHARQDSFALPTGVCMCDVHQEGVFQIREAVRRSTPMRAQNTHSGAGFLRATAQRG
jgi:hypothetical protein